MSINTQLEELGYVPFYSYNGVFKGWKKDDKFYEWNGSGNPTAIGLERNLVEATPPANFSEYHAYRAPLSNGKIITVVTIATTVIGVLVGGVFLATTKNPNISITAGESTKHTLDTIAGVGMAVLTTYMLSQNKAEAIEALFQQAENTWPLKVDPILLDLNGDGVIDTTSIDNGVYFDHNNDSFAEKIAWVGANDGMLVVDKNNNSIIDNGSEVLGDTFTKTDGTIATDGFNALADFDSNSDGVINSNDTNFSDLKVLKGDGTLLSFADAGITSLNLSHSASGTTDSNGNGITKTGTFTDADGVVHNMGDYEFATDYLHTISLNTVDVPDNIASLPDANGFGTVDSLHQAMAKDSSGALKTLISNFVNQSNASARRNLIHDIIFKWTGAENITQGMRGSFDAQKLYALEKFMGHGFWGTEDNSNVNSQAANILNTAYASLEEYVFAQLESQSALKSLYDMISIKINPDTNKIELDLAQVTNYFNNAILNNTANINDTLTDFDRTFKNLGLKDQSNYTEFYNVISAFGDDYKFLLDTSDKTIFYGTDNADSFDGSANGEVYMLGNGNDTVYARQGDDIVYGGDGSDYIDVCEGNDIVYAGAGNDTIYGGYGNDIIDGGTGADSMYGGEGTDIYYVDNVNDKVIDTPVEHYWSPKDDIIYSSVSYTMPKDSIQHLVLTGTENINATGNSYYTYLTGNSGNNVLTGNGYSQNYLDGGAGADTMIGSYGHFNDFYVDNPGDVIIINGKKSTQRQDVISTISYSLENTYIDCLFLKGNDNINATGNNLDNILSGNFGDNIIRGEGGNDSLDDGRGGHNTLYGGTGNDTYYAWTYDTVVTEYENEGNDTIDATRLPGFTLPDNVENLWLESTEDNIIGVGNNLNNLIWGSRSDNILTGGKGNDSLYGDFGDDTYIFNKGDGQDLVFDHNKDGDWMFDDRDYGYDTIKFQSDVNKADIAFFMNGNDLIIDYGQNGGQDVITVHNQNDTLHSIEKFELSDGSYISNADVNLLIQNMTAYAQNNSIEFTNINSVKNDENLMNLVAAAWHN